MAIAWPRSGRTRITFVVVVVVLAAAVSLAGWWFAGGRLGPAEVPAANAQKPEETARNEAAEETPGLVEFPRASWQAAKITLQPVGKAPISQTIELTGKVTLNEDRVAHIYPLVEGRVDQVNVRLGQKVKQGELLVVVQSKEVGQAMLKLYEDRLLLDFAKVKDGWTQDIKNNTHALIDMIRASAPLETIEDAFRQRTLGSHRDTLLSAYIAYHTAQNELERLKPLASDGAVAARRLVEAEAQLNATRATLQSLVEQIRQDTVQESLESVQRVKELQTRVSVDEASLKIIGFSDEDLASVDPMKRGEAISHYPVVAPFDGTIISKDVVLLERVGPENQILSIADLSSVWISAKP
jgi:cobalt-zinc-cadmium efflux system membrane fusion protein